MKRIIYSIISLCLFSMISTSCKDDVTTVISIGETRKLIAECSTTSAIFGDNITYTVAIDQTNDSLSMCEDVDVKLSFSGTYKKTVDGKEETVEVTAADVFENFPEYISLKRGDKKGYVDFTVKPQIAFTPISGTFKTYARGYTINGSEQPITIADKYYTTVYLKNNSDNTVNEGGKFVIVASVGGKAKEDVTVNISTIETENGRLSIPQTSLTIRKGYRSVESEVANAVFSKGKNTYTDATIKFESDSQEHPLINKEIKITIKDLDGGLNEANRLIDEHFVYYDPDIVFVSEGNKSAVEKWDETKTILEIKEGDEHPTPELAEKGWVFLNSFEFSPIDALTAGGKPNQYGNRVPRFTGAQNVANTQKVQSVVNEKYSNMTEDGYLRIWTARDDNLPKTGGVPGVNNAGVSAFYASKFDGVSSGADSWEASNVRILPGTRVEIRCRIRGKKHSFNSALWFQGNIRNVQWSTYGEVDLLENPANKNNSMYNEAYQTFHWNDKNNTTSQGDKYKPSVKKTLNDMDEFNVYWMEWRNNNEIALGINGQENILIKNDGTLQGPGVHKNGGSDWNSSTHWPFSDSYNPEGLHFLITFAGRNEWALGDYTEDFKEEWWSDWKNISYEDSKTNNDTPRMEIDWVRFYKNDNYQYIGGGLPQRNTPMY